MRYIFALIAILAHGTAYADPSSGQTIGPEGGLFSFSCSSITDDRIKCDFTQVKMTIAADEDDWQRRLAEIDDNLEGFESLVSTESCKAFSTMVEVFHSIASEDYDTARELGAEMSDFDVEQTITSLSKMPPRQVTDTMATFQSFVDLCDGVTREKIEAMLRTTYDIEARTCSPFINNWESEFDRVSESVWAIATDGAYGECGVVRLDRFECSADYPVLCDFISEKRIMNPDGKSVLGFSCSALDETKYVYPWKSDALYLDCDIIKF